MSKIKFVNIMLVGLITCGNVTPILSASEVENSVVEVIADINSEEPIEDSELDSEIVIESEASEELTETSEEPSEDSELDSEFIIESEASEELTKTSEESEVSEELTEASEGNEASDIDQVIASEVITESTSKTVKSTKFTGWKDERVNGTGLRKYYSNGVLIRHIRYNQNIITERVEYHSNGKHKTKREYSYNSNTKTNSLSRKFEYNTSGIKIDCKTYTTSGSVSLDYDYDAKGKITRKEFFFTNGQTKEISTFKNNTTYTSRTRYYSNGKVKQTFKYFSNGKVSSSEQYRSDGTYEAFRKYLSDGTLSYSQWYRTNGSKYQYNEYSNGILVYQLTTNNSDINKTATTWDEKGNKIKYELWNNMGLRTFYQRYYANGKIRANYDYHSNGKIKLKQFYYGSGAKKQFEYYNTSQRITSLKTWYSNGVQSNATSYHSNGNRKVITNYNTSSVRTSHVEYYSNGRIYKNFPKYYTNDIPVYSFTYTYHSNGIIKTLKRTDYTFRAERSVMTETYNSNGRQIAESVSSESSTGYFRVPMEGYITCQYECYSNHTGVDFGNTNKTQAVYSTAPGKVVQVAGGCSANGGYLGNNCNYGAGNYIVIEHTYQGRKYFSLYMHLSKINVRVGDTVKYSTEIGNMGNSGNSSGAHLHFELFEDTDKDGYRSDEYRTNPAIFVDYSNRQIKIY